MFCRQCEQTAKGTGCTKQGVCGKTHETATLQDLLVFSLKGIAILGLLAREKGIKDTEADLFLQEGLFTTVTNVNFDPKKIADMIYAASKIMERLKKAIGAIPADAPEPAHWQPAGSMAGLIAQGLEVGLLSDPSPNEDIRSLREILLFGLKGMAAYADHAAILGRTNEEVNAFFYKGLAMLVDPKLTAGDYISLIMEFGKVNLKCLEILDKAHNDIFGTPIPTKVPLGIKKGPAIIVSGHDLLDLKQLLEQTEGKGINIYTHGEMLPAHGYPELKKHKHLAGHFGTAWQNQQKEFDGIPAVVLMTTNCIQNPRESYKGNIYTTGLVQWPGEAHIEAKNGKKDFKVLIDQAKKLGGFSEDKIEKEISVGFGHKTVLSLANKIIDAVKDKKIRYFFLIGGCDGAKIGRNYYTEFAQKVPKDCVILTLACGKFRFNRLDFGMVGDFPRLLDCGQCNDAYSAIQIASALAVAFNCSVNDLPLSLILSWYEQKAVCILLTLLSMGIKNIRLGPTLPAFITPNVLQVFVDKFNIKPITTPDQDLKEILG
ncbi:MAG: hydroxylamine reductase [bacterium]|nr:hydroxylamine reductase [bacterium]